MSRSALVIIATLAGIASSGCQERTYTRARPKIVEDARQLWLAKQYEEALPLLDKAIELDPRCWNAYFIRGSIHHERGEFGLAIDDLSRVIDLSPDFGYAYHCRAASFRALGKYKEAVADLSKAIDLGEDTYLVRGTRGEIYIDLEEFESSIADFTCLIERSPDNPIGYAGRGTAYSDLGDDARAISDFDRALELDPGNKEIYLCRGIHHAMKERYSEMHADLMAALDAGLTGEKADKVRRLLLYGVSKTHKKNLAAEALKIFAAGRGVEPLPLEDETGPSKSGDRQN